MAHGDGVAHGDILSHGDVVAQGDVVAHVHAVAHVDVVAHGDVWWLMEMCGGSWRCSGSLQLWWLVDSALDFWVPGFESCIPHKDSGALQDHCVIM